MQTNIIDDAVISECLAQQSKWVKELNSQAILPESVVQIQKSLAAQTEWLKKMNGTESMARLQDALKAQTDWLKALDTSALIPSDVEDSCRRLQRSLNLAKAPAYLASLQERENAATKNPLSYSVVEEESCKVFDKRICLANIRELLKNSDVKIGQLEKEAGTQPGYMSRLEKKENTTLPSLDFILTASRMLKVSLDVLLTVPLTELSPTASYIVRLLDKLVKDTYECKLDWEKKSASCLNSLDSDINGNVSHPLFVDTRFNDYGQYDANSGVGVVMNSNYFGIDSIIDGDCFSLELKGNTTLYLMRVARRSGANRDQNGSGKEVWICSNRTRQFLTGSRDIPCIKELTEKLFSAVDSNMQHPKLSNDIKASLDAFMMDDFGTTGLVEEIEDDGIPF